MAISTKAELKTAVAAWLERSGDSTVTDQDDNWIVLAESYLTRMIPALRESWTTKTDYTGSVGSRELTLPTDFVEPAWLHMILSGDTQEQELTPDRHQTMPRYATNAPPQRWCILGSKINFDSPCDGAHTFYFRYRQKLALDDDSDTNWLLTHHPDLYLHATLFHAAIYLEKPEFAAGMKGLVTEAINEVGRIESRSSAIAPVRIDPALGAGARFNINIGE